MATLDFLERLDQAEARDSHLLAAHFPNAIGQRSQQLQVAHAVRRQQRQNGMVATSPVRSVAKPLGWESPGRNANLMGSEHEPKPHLTPEGKRIERMLASSGGAASWAFYASETSKFNSSQPMARRGQDSCVVLGAPSPVEQANYMHYLLTR